MYLGSQTAGMRWSELMWLSVTVGWGEIGVALSNSVQSDGKYLLAIA